MVINTTRWVISLTLLTLLCVFPQFSQAQEAQADLGTIEVHDLLQQTSYWTILDARPTSEWEQGHLPGALSFSWTDFTATVKGVKYRSFAPESYALALGRLGIDEKTPIIVYGDADSSWGGEGWVCWMLSWIGHKGPIRLLTGGVQAWESEHLRLSKSTSEKKARKKYQIDVRPELNISAAKLSSDSRLKVLIDTRSTLEWYLGHLPGAIHIPWKKFYRGKDRRPISVADYRELLEGYGIDQNLQVVFYCTGGIRSAYAWLVHQLSGYDKGINFEGGKQEWDKHQR